MNHPDTLLAEYVDGAVADVERRDLEAHVATCARCRQEVALARAARSALRSAPPVVAPPDLGDAAIRAAAGAPTDLDRARERRSPTRWIAAAAGVAAVVVLLAVASPKLGSSPSTVAAGAGAQSAGDASFAVASGVES